MVLKLVSQFVFNYVSTSKKITLFAIFVTICAIQFITQSCGDLERVPPVSCESAEDCNCGTLILDTRDDKEYKTVWIGGKCWMQENLNVGEWTNDFYSIVADPNNDIIQKFCQSDSFGNCEDFGGFYIWSEATKVAEPQRGICPKGWHLPTKEDFIQLCESIDYNGKELVKINTNGTHFDGLLTGYKNDANGFPNTNLFYLIFWTSTPYSEHSDSLPAYCLFYSNLNSKLSVTSSVPVVPSNQNNLALCIRCLKD